MFIECKDVFKLFTDPVSNIQIPALRGVEFSVNEGDLSAIIGPSGAGKSTLISLIGGIDKPSSGSIIVHDKIIEKLSTKELTEYRRQNVGFLYQSPRKNLVWNISAFQNVVLPMQLANRLS
ncbi:MAG: ATP-binding cassette domain-containing protein [Candidatus Hodarchaeales archaeon]